MYLFLLYHQKQRVTDELYYMAEKTIFVFHYNKYFFFKQLFLGEVKG